MEKNYSTATMEVRQHITANGRYYAGKAGSRFYRILRDESRILGSRCRNCNLVYWPPRSTCGRCFSQLPVSEMVEIGPEGTLETYTCISYESPAHPEKKPLIYGLIRLDGADTSMAHLIGDVNPGELKIGMRMKPVFKTEKNGNILDIKHFQPT